jgi:hypothetical protein
VLLWRGRSGIIASAPYHGIEPSRGDGRRNYHGGKLNPCVLQAVPVRSKLPGEISAAHYHKTLPVITVLAEFANARRAALLTCGASRSCSTGAGALHLSVSHERECEGKAQASPSTRS